MEPNVTYSTAQIASDADFNAVISKEYAMVVYGHSLCQYSLLMLESLKEAVEEPDFDGSKMAVGSIDCSNRERCHNVRYYPFALIFKQGRMMMEYEGPRDAQTLG